MYIFTGTLFLVTSSHLFDKQCQELHSTLETSWKMVNLLFQSCQSMWTFQRVELEKLQSPAMISLTLKSSLAQKYKNTFKIALNNTFDEKNCK